MENWNNPRKKKNTSRARTFGLKAAVKPVDGSNYTPTIVVYELYFV